MLFDLPASADDLSPSFAHLFNISQKQGTMLLATCDSGQVSKDLFCSMPKISFTD